MRLAVALLCIAGLVCAQKTAKPNFSGTWVLNTQKSRIKDPPASATFRIRHQEPNWHLSSTHVYQDGKRYVSDIDLRTDGTHELVTHERGYDSRTRMYWDGDVLVRDEKARGKDGTAGANVVRYSLSPDGKTLTATEHDEVSGSAWTNQWVFERQ